MEVPDDEQLGLLIFDNHLRCYKPVSKHERLRRHYFSLSNDHAIMILDDFLANGQIVMGNHFL